MQTLTMSVVQPLTEAYLMQLEAEGYRFEVVDGELVEVEVTGEKHSWIEGNILYHFKHHVRIYDLRSGVYPGDTDFVLDGELGNIRLRRQPDVALVKAENVVATDGYIYRAPDLAVEIISPSQSYNDVHAKALEYLHYGTEQVWIVSPTLQKVEVWSVDGTSRRYGLGDSISGGDLLPGFVLAVEAVFER